MLNNNGKKNLILSLTAAALAAAPAAQAAVNVQSYTSAANSTYTLTEDAMLEIAPKDPSWHGRRLFFSANYNWINDPFVEYNAQRTQLASTLVDSMQTIDLTVGAFLHRRFSLNASAGLNLVHVPELANQFAFGDARVFGKWRLTEDKAIVHVSLMPELRLPTGDRTLFLSDGSVSPGLSLAFERDFGALRAAANIGYRYSANAQYRDLNYKQRIPMALGIYAPIGNRWGINAEAAGAIVLPRDRFNNPGELYAGARYQFSRDMAFMGGVSIGTVEALNGNDVRLNVGLRFSPMPDAPVVAAAPAPAPVAKLAPVNRVVFTAKEIQISEEVKFHHASAVLTDSGRMLLDEVAAVMKHNRQGFRKILIEGHTNELGSYPYNQTLSERRAESVREYLMSRGITARELMSIGYGKTKPKMATNGLSKDAKLAANRRVEFRVIN